ncbi:AhpC/TSA antioxidant enzyme [Teratosphaeria destructans]|uniref:AhpC/TSA antioxidant enzyme n=1 Tax=Teratosphaeria destructans TaxID=418781 RepID=A0A9W7W182_9PEZI|nr:AhpC/TSA antioxidant enzyme [Teratosphaeria destructans]
MSTTPKSNGPHYSIPDPKILSSASSLQVLAEDNTPHAFSSLPIPTQQTLIVFIRHFYCGYCEDYVRALATQLPPSRLSTTTPPTTLKIIGCGQPTVVADYKRRTNCPFEIYCDPTRALYKKLGMMCSLELGPKPGYAEGGALGRTWASMCTLLGSGIKGLKGGGAYDQNGGEWVFGADGELKWCRRMRNTRDHAEIKELEEVLELKGVEKD